MTLRDELLAENHGDIREAAAIMAHRLNRGNAEYFKAGYSRENAILAAIELFPEVTVAEIRSLNLWATSGDLD